MTPDTRGVEALVPVKPSVHCPFSAVVDYSERNQHENDTTLGFKPGNCLIDLINIRDGNTQ